MVVRFVLGVIGMVVFGIATVINLLLLLLVHRAMGVFLPLTIVFAAVFVFSLLLVTSGQRHKAVIGRLSCYLAALSDKNVLLLEDVATLTGVLPARIKSDMRVLKRKNLQFDLYMDKEETSLLRGSGAYNTYIETERQREAREREDAERQNRLRDPETATLETFRIESVAMQEKLRAANLLLPGELISRNLSELEKTTKRIFDHIESHPEKLPETRKLMSYHLPTTLMLIEKYCQYDMMEYQSENVAQAKTEIEKALAAANEAFSNFLEGLFRVDTLDVQAEAEVLTKIFEQDGLTGKKFDL